MRAKEATDFPMKETPIKVTAEPFGEPPSIHEETPESVGEALPAKVGEAIDPGIPSGEVHEEKAILVATGANPVPVTDICPDRVAGTRGLRDRATAGPPVDVDSIPDSEGGLAVSSDMKTIPEVG